MRTEIWGSCCYCGCLPQGALKGKASSLHMPDMWKECVHGYCVNYLDHSQHSQWSSCQGTHHPSHCWRSAFYCSVGCSDSFYCCCFHPWQAQNSNWECVFHLLTSHVKRFMKMKLVTTKSYGMVSPHQTSSHKGLL